MIKDYVVDIIVPFYNNEKYIEECIKSIVKQKYDKINIILIDDGSTDKSANIAKDVLSEYSRNYKFIQNRVTRGVSYSRNLGLRMVTGDLVTFVDADDVLKDNHILNLVNTMSVSDDIFLGVTNFSRNKEILHKDVNGNYIVYDEKNTWRNIFGLGKIQGYLWNKIFKSSIIRKANLNFKNNLSICEDLVFVTEYLKSLKVFEKKVKCSFYTGSTYYYRINENSVLEQRVNEESILKKGNNELLAYTTIENLCVDNVYFKKYLIRKKRWVENNLEYSLGGRTKLLNNFHEQGNSYLNSTLLFGPFLPVKDRIVFFQKLLVNIIRRYI